MYSHLVVHLVDTSITLHHQLSALVVNSQVYNQL